MSGICLFCAHAKSTPQRKNNLSGHQVSEVLDYLLGGQEGSCLKIFCHERPEEHWEANSIEFSCDNFKKADHQQIRKRIAFFKKSCLRADSYQPLNTITEETNNVFEAQVRMLQTFFQEQ